MKLSAPVFILKQQARLLSRKEKVPLHQALDLIAHREGFDSWGLLSKTIDANKPGTTLLAQLHAGDLLLVGSRPSQGKTLLGIKAAIHAMRRGRHQEACCGAMR